MRYCLVDIIRLDSTVNVVLCEVNYRKNYRLARACVCLTRYPFFCFIRQILPEFNALRCLIDQWISFVVSFQVEWIKIQAHVYIYLSISVSSVCRCVCVCARFFLWISYFLIISHQLNWWELYAQIEINQSGIFQVALRLSFSFVSRCLYCCWTKIGFCRRIDSMLGLVSILPIRLHFKDRTRKTLEVKVIFGCLSVRWIRCFWALSSRQVRVTSLYCTFVTAGTFDESDALDVDDTRQVKRFCRRPSSRRTYRIRLNWTTDIIVQIYHFIRPGYYIHHIVVGIVRYTPETNGRSRARSTAEKQKRFWPICWAFDVKWARKIKMVASKGSCWWPTHWHIALEIEYESHKCCRRT